MANSDRVILVDRRDCELGTMLSDEAHHNAKLHRGISVFLFNNKGEWLINQRSLCREHSCGMWSNSCNAHPSPGESNEMAAARQLQYELGIKDVKLIELFSFIYLVSLTQDLSEHEFDHVYVGITNLKPTINKDLVNQYQYLQSEDLAIDLRNHPDDYSFWMQLISGRIIRELSSKVIIPHV